MGDSETQGARTLTEVNGTAWSRVQHHCLESNQPQPAPEPHNMLLITPLDTFTIDLLSILLLIQVVFTREKPAGAGV